MIQHSGVRGPRAQLDLCSHPGEGGTGYLLKRKCEEGQFDAKELRLLVRTLVLADWAAGILAGWSGHLVVEFSAKNRPLSMSWRQFMGPTCALLALAFSFTDVDCVFGGPAPLLTICRHEIGVRGDLWLGPVPRWLMTMRAHADLP